MRSLIASLCLLVAACNQLLGIDAVTSQPRDRDGDGILDGDDNCPDRANPLQVDVNGDGVGDICNCVEGGTDTDGDGTDDECDECVGPGFVGNDSNGDGIDDGCQPCPLSTGADIDGDGIDDACDACLMGPPHDEDTDGVPDGCDVCPTRADPDQRKMNDADPIGDACDIRQTHDAVAFFDAFTKNEVSLWSAQTGWTTSGDALHAADGSFARKTLKTAQAPYLFETRIDGAGGIIVADELAQRTDLCALLPDRYLRVDHETNLVMSELSGKPVEGTGPVRLRWWIEYDNGTVLRVISHCEALDEVGTVVNEAVLDVGSYQKGGIGLSVESGGATFEYFWGVELPEL